MATLVGQLADNTLATQGDNSMALFFLVALGIYLGAYRLDQHISRPNQWRR